MCLKIAIRKLLDKNSDKGGEVCHLKLKYSKHSQRFLKS